MLTLGLFSIGLDTYWPQFDGLRDRLLGYQERIVTKLGTCVPAPEPRILNAGMVDTPERAREAADRFHREGVDLIVLFVSTYALSHTVLPVAQRGGAPVLILNLQPIAAIDYAKLNAMGDRGRMTGEWLAHCQACVAPEISSVFRRAGVPVHLVTGYLEDAEAWTEIGEYLAAARVKRELAELRMGVVGHYYNGMLDVYADLTLLAARFGCHFELREFGELRRGVEEATEAQIAAKREEFNTTFTVAEDCGEEELQRAATTAVALDTFVDRHQLGALAYYYEGAGDADYERIITSVIPGLTLLTGRGIPVAGECEVKNALAMKIMDSLGAGGSFAEFYAMDFTDEVILLGHDGPAHPRTAAGEVSLVPVPVYHGKPGRGLSIQMEVANGPITMLSVCEDGHGRVYLVLAEGESVAGPTLQIGNTNSRYRFSLPIRQFMNEWSLAGPSHHCAIGLGHHGGTLRKLGALLGMDVITVC